MELRRAVASTLRSRRFWVWQIAGAIIYAIPVAIRYATKSLYIPILSFPGFWIGHFIPGNLVEKILVNAFFPGGAGGVAGEILANNHKDQTVIGKTKYLYRLEGALGQTAAWSAFQYWGFSLMISGPHGSGNLFEHATVFPFNFLLATFSIFTPDIVYFVKSKIETAYRHLSRRRNSKS